MTRFWKNLHQVCSKSKDWKAQQLKMLEAIKPKGISSIVKIGNGHLCFSEENLSFISFLNYLELYISITNISNKLYQT